MKNKFKEDVHEHSITNSEGDHISDVAGQGMSLNDMGVIY